MLCTAVAMQLEGRSGGGMSSSSTRKNTSRRPGIVLDLRDPREDHRGTVQIVIETAGGETFNHNSLITIPTTIDLVGRKYIRASGLGLLASIFGSVQRSTSGMVLCSVNTLALLRAYLPSRFSAISRTCSGSCQRATPGSRNRTSLSAGKSTAPIQNIM